MRGMTRRWRYRDAAPRAGDAGTPGLVERILSARGLADPAEVSRFCEPKLSDLHDPALLPGVDRAAERVIAAVRDRQPMVIYGDYDVDGITASAILYHTIKTADPEAPVRCYVPHRIDEGYGLNVDALGQLHEQGAQLVISVDCGISAKRPAEVAKQLGLDLIITDHHNLPTDSAELPEAAALVHPRLPGSGYPFGELCGAGVAFKLAWRFATKWCNSERVSENFQRTLLDLLPLAALGTIADIVPLVDENRVLARFGLAHIKQTANIGLRALIEESGLMDAKIDSEKVGFILGPRLNACGRMGHAAEAVEMLTTADAERAHAIAHRLAELNRWRQKTEREIVEQAEHLAIEHGMTERDCRAIVLAHHDWHPGVVGIACSRLVDKFHRPTILMQRNGALCKGSARSIEGFSIHAALCQVANFLTTYGGHDAAAGLSLDVENLEPFTSALTAHANETITEEQLTPCVTVDCEARLDELRLDNVKPLSAMSPFGAGNPRPIVHVADAVVADAPRQMGREGKHLDLRVRGDDAGGRQWLRCVWWNAGHLAGDLATGMRVDLAVEPKLNTFNGTTRIEGELRDVRVQRM